MKIEVHTLPDAQIAEVLSEDIIINNAADALDVLGNVYYQGFDSMILHEKNITPEFFDLKNGMAGETLQKFSNYRVRLVIVGDFTHHTSASFQAFMRESNRGTQVNFAHSAEQALEKLANR